MKNLKIYFIVLTCLAITACVNGQIRRTVYGNHKVVKQERTAGSFTGIRVSAGIDVYVKQGDKESITVEADENLQEYIRTDISGDVLKVGTDANIRDAEKKNVYVTMREIKSLNTSSAGDIVCETPFKTDNLELSASSAGGIKIEVTAKSIKADISSSGNITVDGTADLLEADLSSAGDLNAYELAVKEADVTVSSAGDADINVSEKLTARASSAGGINYRGDPKYVDAHSSSAGGIHKR
jgi:hypothetical protein